MKILKINTKKLKRNFKRLIWILADKAFLTFLILFLIGLIFNGIIFYRYNILIKKAEIKTTEIPFQFKEKIFQDVLKTWQEKENRFNETETKQYPDPFRMITTIQE